MSNIAIKGATTGTGTFTIESPATNTDRTLTLPDEAGTILTTTGDGSGLTGISSYADSDALSLFNVTGSAPVYACRAWVNFNGTGTVAIRESGNVSSISDRGLGRYTVNFSTSMPDTNYATTTTGKMTSAVTNGGSVTSVDDGGGGVYTTSAVSIISLAVSGSEADTSIYAVAVFR